MTTTTTTTTTMTAEERKLARLIWDDIARRIQKAVDAQKSQ